jgi:hypothetical protein
MGCGSMISCHQSSFCQAGYQLMGRKDLKVITVIWQRVLHYAIDSVKALTTLGMTTNEGIIM